MQGKLSAVGSDTLVNLMTFWTESFQRVYPGVKPQVQGPGSSAAPTALIEGTAQLGPMSRTMTDKEIDTFEKKFGYKPTKVPVAIDALAVFVHKDNPIEKLTMKQLDAIFSSTYKRQGSNIGTWGGAGLSGEWASRPIALYGRNSASGTYGFFKEHALKKGDFKNSVGEQSGSATVVQKVAGDLGGVGYSGIGYLTAGVKALPLAEKDDGEVVAPSYENCVSGTYPMWRFLYVYVNKKPGAPLEPLTGEFLKYVLSRSGQEVVVKDGYFPLPKAAIDEALAELAK